MENNLIHSDYKKWLQQLKLQFINTQLKAAITVNSALLEFYWNLGNDIIEKQKSSTWGDGFLKQLSQDLMIEFPDIKGFSFSNIKYIRQWVRFYLTPDQKSQQLVGQITKQTVAQLFQIPWGHNLKIISKSQFKELGFIEQCCHSVNAALPFFRERGDFTDWVFPRLSQNEGINIPQNIQFLLEVIKMSPHLSAPKLAQQLNISLASVERHIKWLKKHNLLQRIGAKKDGYWEILND